MLKIIKNFSQHIDIILKTFIPLQSNSAVECKGVIEIIFVVKFSQSFIRHEDDEQ